MLNAVKSGVSFTVCVTLQTQKRKPVPEKKDFK